MDSQKMVIVFAADLLVIGFLSACNLGGRVTTQANQFNPAAVEVNAATTTLTSIPRPITNNAKPTASSTVAPKQSNSIANSNPPTPTVTMAVQSSSNKKEDDIEQQLDQLLNSLDSTDTVDDAGK
jgi:hypothetical protein